MIINKINDEKYEVNDKICFRNLDGDWVCPTNDLTPAEEKAFREYLNANSGQKQI